MNMIPNMGIERTDRYADTKVAMIEISEGMQPKNQGGFDFRRLRHTTFDLPNVLALRQNQ